LLDTALSGGLHITSVDDEEEAMIAVGVDTHKHEHLARALDGLGQLLGGMTIEVNLHGYMELAQWVRQLGDDVVVGIEGAGSFGAGLCEYLLAEGIRVVEVERPRRQDRRRGKSDEIDALLAAKKVLAGEGLSTPRAGGTRQALQALLVAYRSCMAERTRLLNQLQALHTTAPIALRERIGPGNGKQLTARLARMRGCARAPESEQLILSVLRDLARRARELSAQADTYEHELTRLIRSLDPTLLDERGVGPISAAKLLACDPQRLKSEAAFARCNGTAPKPASSGQTVRYRLSRGGDRQANNALHTIALSRSIHDDQTRAYLQRRITEGKTNREAMRALKRHLSRSLYKRLLNVPLTS
jgi:transposase